MESKTQNLVIKIVTGLSILFGVLFTIWVMGDDNPKEVSLEDQQKWANYKSENESAEDVIMYIIEGRYNSLINEETQTKNDKEAKKNSLENPSDELIEKVGIEYINAELEDINLSIESSIKLIEGLKKEYDDSVVKLDKKIVALNFLEESYPETYEFVKDSIKKNEKWEWQKDHFLVRKKDTSNKQILEHVILRTSDVASFTNELTSIIASEKQETLDTDVSWLINFSLFIIYLGVGLILLAFIYIMIIDLKKGLKILAGIGVFAIFVYIVYLSSKNVSIEELKFYNDKLLNITVSESDLVIAKTAITSTLILIAVATVSWIGSPVFKFFRK